MNARLLAIPLCLVIVTSAVSAQDSAREKPAAGESEAIFKSLDTNGDGVLRAGEVPESRARFFQRLVRIGDRNGDGQLTRNEFLAALAGDDPPTTRPSDRPANRQRSGRSRAGSGPVFARLDRNRDGKLTLAEMPEYLRNRFQTILRRNNTDSLTREEFDRNFRPAGPPPADPQADRQRRERLFQQLDKNRDGKLTGEETTDQSRRVFDYLAKRLQKKAGETITKQEFLDLFASPAPTTRRRQEDSDRPRTTTEAPSGPLFLRLLDTNRDGRLSRDELSRAAERFEHLDADGDGQVDLRELIGPAPSGSRRPDSKRAATPRQNTGRSLFDRLDSNGNGTIESDEIPASLKNRLRRYDQNRDGKIDPGEFRSGVQRQPPQRPRPPGD